MIINGRFQHAEAGGFRRYAVEVSARIPEAEVVSPSARLARGAAGKLWEQTVLARRARDDVLWSPATSGPVRHPRHVVTLHDLAPLLDPGSVSGRFGAIHRLLIPTLARSAQVVLVDSAVIGAQIMARFEVPESRVMVAEPGVADVFRQVASVDRMDARRQLGLDRLGIDIGAPIVGGLLSTIPRKNASGLLATLEAVAATGPAEVLVAGWDGPERVFGRRDRLASPDVHDLTSLSDEEMALLYRSVDVFVWLPRHEGFGLPVVEAAAAGTPVVCTDVPAAVEHLIDVAVVVENSEQAASAVRELLADEVRREAMGARAIESVEHLTWDRTAALVHKALRYVEEIAA